MNAKDGISMRLVDEKESRPKVFLR